MRIYIICGGAFFMVAAGVYLYYKLKSPIKFQSLKLLDKSSTLHILSQIRSEFSQKFTSTLRTNRKKRRNQHRGGREYKNLIKELKDQAKKFLQKAMDDVLARNGITEEILSDSAKHLDSDEDVKKSIGKLCSVEVTKAPSSLSLSNLEEILEFYLTKAEEFNEEDPNELNLKMKMLEDEIFDEFKFEPEEIEAAVNKYENDVQELIISIRDLNNNLLEHTKEELFF